MVALARIWLVAPPKIIWRRRLCVYAPFTRRSQPMSRAVPRMISPGPLLLVGHGAEADRQPVPFESGDEIRARTDR